MIKPKAFLFDLNGTMIDDMGFHLQVWNKILNEDLKAGLTKEQVKYQMYGKNQELLDRVFGRGTLSEETSAFYSRKKEELYQEMYRPYLELIPGLGKLLEHARQAGVLLAIGSAANRLNIDFVLDNLDIRSYFGAIVGAEEVVESKPNPEVFLKAARLLQLKPEECLVFEDVPKGAEAALNAGMRTVILTTTHEEEEFEKFPNVLFCTRDYTDQRVQELLP
jgi:HAD superfamily hydrolase (TIGR01509 family)